MLYEEARVYLEQVSKYGSVLGLDSIRELLERLGNPQDELTFVHIAGTNGKGSTLAYISTILTEAGYKVGRYISPTILAYLERFQINGTWMPQEKLGLLTEKVKRAADAMTADGLPAPTVFEVETAIAFLYFAEEKCQVVTLETGMGGLLDATNIVKNTKVCVFASISRDHMAFLGDSLSEIAENKAGIIKKGAKVVSAPQKEEVLQVLRNHAQQVGTDVIISEPEKIILHENGLDGQTFSYKNHENMIIHLLGDYQLSNVSTALEVVDVLKVEGYAISEEAVRQGLEKTRWSGRFQVLGEEPLVIVDGAHNMDAIDKLAENIEKYLKRNKIIAIMGVFKDKEYPQMVEKIAPYLEKVYAVELPNKERTLSKEILRDTFVRCGVETETAENHLEALKQAIKECEGHPEEVILGFGSLSYLGDMIGYMGKE